MNHVKQWRNALGGFGHCRYGFFYQGCPFCAFWWENHAAVFHIFGESASLCHHCFAHCLLLAENDSAFLSLWFARSDCCPCCGFGASLETEQFVEYRRRHRSLHGVGAMCLCIKTPFRKRGFLNCEGEKGDHKRRYLVPSCLRAFVPSCLRAFGNGTIKGDDS